MENTMQPRMISKNSSYAAKEFGLALQSMLAIELHFPSEQFWLVSPWLSDIPVLDNSTERFNALHRSLPPRVVTLSDYFKCWLQQSSGTLWIVTQFTDATKSMRQQIETLQQTYGDKVCLLQNDNLHEKICLTTHWMLSGSMNWTRNGLTKWDEFQRFDRDPETLSTKRIDLQEQYGALV